MPDDPIEAARALLPWWVPWANVLLLAPVVALLTAAVTWTAAWIASRPLVKARRAGPLPWHEEARLAWPLRRSVNRLALIELVMIPCLAFALGNELSRVSGGWLWLLLLAVAIRTIAMVARRFRTREREAPVRFRQLVKGLLFLALVFARLPVIVAMAFLIGPTFDLQAWIATALGLAALVLLSTNLWVALARLAWILRPPSPRLLDAVRSMSERVGLAMPSIFEADLPIANAFAVPRRQLLVVTVPALELFDDEELAAVCGHELGHLTESRRATFVRSLAIVALLPIAFVQPIGARIAGPPTGMLIASLIALLVAIVTGVSLRGLFHRMEHRADRIAHEHSGEGGAYLRALEKLHKDNRLPLTFVRDPTRKRGLLRRLFSRDVHGSFAERVAALGGTLPPGLKPPSRWRGPAAVLAGGAILVLGLTAAIMFPSGMVELMPGGSTALTFAIALDSSPSALIDSLADRRAKEGDLGAAITLKRAALAMDDWIPTRLSLAGTLADAGAIDEAAAIVAPIEDEARSRTWFQAELKEVQEKLERARAKEAAPTDDRSRRP